MHLPPEKSLFPLETMSQFAETVIPDESPQAGDPESSESDELRQNL
jgi:hypothetical protein